MLSFTAACRLTVQDTGCPCQGACRRAQRSKFVPVTTRVRLPAMVIYVFAAGPPTPLIGASWHSCGPAGAWTQVGSTGVVCRCADMVTNIRALNSAQARGRRDTAAAQMAALLQRRVAGCASQLHEGAWPELQHSCAGFRICMPLPKALRAVGLCTFTSQRPRRGGARRA